ncbi:MAG TPA: HAMP domain-containing protein [Fimbriimonas sp.]|nr:HAMP domain-containing protein [Fimbriimonas sp.]
MSQQTITPKTRKSSSTRSDNSNGSYSASQLMPLLKALQAAQAGDFSVRLPEKRNGVLGQIYAAFNDVITLSENEAQEIVRVGRLVGREGRMTERAALRGASGAWAESVEGINQLIEDLARPTTEVARVITAVAQGDLTQKMALEIEGTPVKGEFLRIGQTVNTMVGQLGSFAAEVTRVAREVGTEGKLGGQAEVKGVSGTWKDLTDNVNILAGNLTNQVRNIALVTTAVANGDLSQKITVDVRGEILELKNTINTMVDQLSSFAAEVTRVAREVGTEGKLGGQAEVRGVSGTWKDLTDNVNLLASNLTNQVRNIALVTTAVANGDLSQKITVDARGEILELKATVNVMVDQLNSFAAEVARVAREVGTEGILGGQAEVRGVSGTWKDLTDNVNFMASNLTTQVRSIAKVVTAVANGELKQKLILEAKGEVAALADTINGMIDTLSIFAEQVTTVAREVGTEGKLGGQAEVPNVAGTWKDLTDNVNLLAGNLTNQVRNIALVTTAVANGDLSQKITVDAKGEILELKNTINTMVDQLNSFAAEVSRVAREVGTEGILGGQAQVRDVRGTWKDLTDNVNGLAGNLTNQVRNIALVTTAVANGDLSQKITVDVKGEILELKNTINTMVDQLSSFAAEVTRVAREVGTEGKLGGQAEVKGVSGTWKDLTDNVNFMASNLTTQVRGIVKVVTAVANGDLSQKLFVEAKGEIAALAETINSMTETLSIFAEQVTTVAREVGTEGILGGQAKVPNVAGTWNDLTDNVNGLAGNLTNQVRAISEVATAVASGDLTRSIMVEAQGEVLTLKNNINQMIANLKDTTQQNNEQDWLKTNLARFSGMMQGQKTLESVARLIMSELTPLVDAHHGVFYIADFTSEETLFRLQSSYGFKERKHISNSFALGESLVGQCALERKNILLTKVPSDYIQINSGLGEAPPLTIIVLPVLFEGETMAVIELASFQSFSPIHRNFLNQLMESIGVVLNVISANMRTEQLLQQSQSLTQELQSQSEELQNQQEQLRRTNAELEHQAKELEDKASLLAEQNHKVELKNREVELARAALEEKAEQLALSSKYKSEFLANMSHELRTPLNSMLILAKLLSENDGSNLTEKQVDYASTIHASGGDLLNLINEILDLSKIEAGKMDIEIVKISPADIREYVQRTFAHMATEKKLEFSATISTDVPSFIHSDMQRLQQVLRNLLSNSFKFTEMGSVGLDISVPNGPVMFDDGSLVPANRLIAFRVTDTGVGIPKDKQKLIFEAFQQADGTTSRKYGGTGLGLSISREISKLLGGKIEVESEPGEGSTFTLYLPRTYRVNRMPLEPDLISDDSDDSIPYYKPIDEPTPAPTRSGNGGIRLKPILDDQANVNPSDRVLLIVEDDLEFAAVLLDLARKNSLKGIIAPDGETGLEMARRYGPSSILLDIQMPGIDGWNVLDELKRNPRTRHIPVTIVSGADPRMGMAMGAIAYIEKPASVEALEVAFGKIDRFLDRQTKELLLIEDDLAVQKALVDLIHGPDVRIRTVGTGAEGLKALDENEFDCVVLDLMLPDMSGSELLQKVRKHERYKNLPVIVYTSKELNRREEAYFKRHAACVINKGPQSMDRLFDETALFLHRSAENLTPYQRKIVESLYSRPVLAAIKGTSNGKTDSVPEELKDEPEVSLAGRKILVVDDDVRNIFALTSTLEKQGMVVLFDERGKHAVKTLKETPDVEVVLMDVMMPEMDGYETMRVIRQMKGRKDLPIIAITAKAMAGDREKCLDAGATDYLSKPVDTGQLFSMIRRLVAASARTSIG